VVRERNQRGLYRVAFKKNTSVVLLTSVRHHHLPLPPRTHDNLSSSPHHLLLCIYLPALLGDNRLPFCVVTHDLACCSRALLIGTASLKITIFVVYRLESANRSQNEESVQVMSTMNCYLMLICSICQHWRCFSLVCGVSPYCLTFAATNSSSVIRLLKRQFHLGVQVSRGLERLLELKTLETCCQSIFHTRWSACGCLILTCAHIISKSSWTKI
jgi:hypothetical protein